MFLKISISLLLTNMLMVLSVPVSGIELTEGSPLEKSRVETCRTGLVDAATRTKNGITYFFKGEYYWKYEETKGGIVDYRLISDDWKDVEGPIDAALTWDDGSTFLFKGEDYWKFVNQVAQPGYPRKIDDGFKGIPNDLDAAMVWSKNSVTYFFKGDQYWKYDPKATTPTDGKSEPITAWTGVPNNIDAAIRWEGGRTYFFKGSTYYKYDNEAESVPKEYPYSTVREWFDCEKQANSWKRFERYLPVEIHKTSEDVVKAIADLKDTTEILNNKIMTKQSITMRNIAQLILTLKNSTHLIDLEGKEPIEENPNIPLDWRRQGMKSTESSLGS